MAQEIKIEEISTIETYREIYMTKNLKVNGKEVKVYAWDKKDEELQDYDSDIEVNQNDNENLTEEESEALDEYLNDCDWGCK